MASYLMRLRLEGEEDRERGEEQDVPSEDDMSLFISSLLRRDTARGGDWGKTEEVQRPPWVERPHGPELRGYASSGHSPDRALLESMLETLWRPDEGRLEEEVPRRRCSAVGIVTSQSLHHHPQAPPATSDGPL